MNAILAPTGGRRGCRLPRRTAPLLFLALAAALVSGVWDAQAQIIIIRYIWIVVGGGGGGGAPPVLTRSLAADAVNDVTVSGEYAFLANGARGLQPVDLRDPAVPVRLPLLDAGGYARSIARLDHRVYLAAQEAGVQIFDITVPTEPVFVTNLVPTYREAARQAHLVVVSTDYLCVGTDNGELAVFTGPGMTNQVGEISLGGPGSLLAIELRDAYAFVTVKDGGLSIVDLTDPAHPVVVGRWPESGGTFPGLALAGDYAFLTAPGGLQVLSLTNLFAPVEVGFTSVPGQLTGVRVVGDYAYVAAGSSGLQILSLANPAAPVLVAGIETDGFALAVALDDHYVVVADDLGGTSIIDVTDPAHPVLVSGVPAGTPPPNDDFANRILVPPSDCPTEATGTSRYATKEIGEPNHADNPGGQSVWWRWTAPFSGPVQISTAGSSFNTLVAVYVGNNIANLDLVAANDNASGSDGFSAVQFDAVAETEYQIAVDGYGRDHGQIRLSLLPLEASVPLIEALDQAELAWTSGGHRPWLGQRCLAHDGVDAARSGAIEASEETWLETEAFGPGLVRFWWRVSSQENGDWLRFAVNGIEQAARSGDGPWQERSFWLGTGTNTLRWTYAKDSNGSAGHDGAWLDEVSFSPAPSSFLTRLGDLDGDSLATVLDTALLTAYLRDHQSLQPQAAAFADVNGDSIVDANDLPALADAILGRSALQSPADTDGDGIPDVLEAWLGFDPAKADSNDNTIPDGQEDSDLDGYTNQQELELGTHPSRLDTDGDGWSDDAELTVGSSPLDAASGPSLMIVSVPPVALVSPADEGSGGLAMNTTVASPPVAFVLPAHEGPGGLAENTLVAMPPVAMVLPANEGPGGLALNTTLALPPVALVLPANQGAEGLAPNTTVALPPVALVLPANQGAEGLAPNTTIATPPVSLVLPADQGLGGLTNNTVVAMPPAAMLLPWDQGEGGLALNTTIALPPTAFVLPLDEGPAGLTNNTVIARPPVQIKLEVP